MTLSTEAIIAIVALLVTVIQQILPIILCGDLWREDIRTTEQVASAVVEMSLWSPSHLTSTSCLTSHVVDHFPVGLRNEGLARRRLWETWYALSISALI